MNITLTQIIPHIIMKDLIQSRNQGQLMTILITRIIKRMAACMTNMPAIIPRTF